MHDLSVTPLPCRPGRGWGERLLWAATGTIPVRFPLQIKIIKRLSLRQAEQDLVQIYQYKIQDRNVTFFAPGLSAAVL